MAKRSSVAAGVAAMFYLALKGYCLARERKFWKCPMPMRLLFVSIFVAVGWRGALAEEKQLVIGDQLEIARKNFEATNFSAAHAALDRLEKANQPTVEWLDLRGCLYMEQSKFGEAARAFEAAHDANPAIFTPRIHMGDLMLRQKKFGEARDIYEALLKETNILSSTERLRFGILVTYLGEHHESAARTALEQIRFPTQTPAYYYAQAAWALATTTVQKRKSG